VATLVVYRQIDFMRLKDLGFASDQILMISLWDSPVRHNLESFKAQLKQNPKVLGVSGASGTPGSGSSKASNFWVETPDGKKEIYLTYILSDYEFVETFGLTIVDGRDFSRQYVTDATEGYILNETAVRQLGLEDPLGRRIYRGDKDREGQVIGIVKDFHYYSPRSKIDPMAIFIDPSQAAYAAVRIYPADINGVLPEIEAAWRERAPQFPFEHFFTDESFERRFRFDRKVGELLSAFSALAVVICCLGVFGLISFTTEQSSKEIGIRKVLGGSTLGIVMLLSKQFLRWVVIANLVAWPAAWYLMNSWLQEFAYRASVSVAVFFLAGFLSLVVAVLSVSYQSIKAALADPIECLRYE
jgi:putative ABC transport system permease protein